MFKIEKVININIKDLHEWLDNPVKRQAVPDSELRKSIEEHGLTLDTIAVVPDETGYLVVDGNRRLRIAKELDLNGEFASKVYSKDVDLTSLALILNGTGKAWDRQTYTQFVINHPERIELLPKRYKLSTKLMFDLLKTDYEWFALNCRPNAFDWGVELAKYIGKEKDDEFVRKTVLWVGKHKLISEARRAIDSFASQEMIEKAIIEDKPLKLVVTS